MFPSPIEGTVGDGHEDKGEVGVEYNLHDFGGLDEDTEVERVKQRVIPSKNCFSNITKI